MKNYFKYISHSSKEEKKLKLLKKRRNGRKLYSLLFIQSNTLLCCPLNTNNDPTLHLFGHKFLLSRAVLSNHSLAQSEVNIFLQWSASWRAAICLILWFMFGQLMAWAKPGLPRLLATLDVCGKLSSCDTCQPFNRDPCLVWVKDHLTGILATLLSCL